MASHRYSHASSPANPATRRAGLRARQYRPLPHQCLGIAGVNAFRRGRLEDEFSLARHGRNARTALLNCPRIPRAPLHKRLRRGSCAATVTPLGRRVRSPWVSLEGEWLTRQNGGKRLPNLPLPLVGVTE